ncbi:MAG: hypothetical protein OXM55_05965 [Bdellovibrionales bacterium]|nr:hypothetical protein [Bdellovibrionales bacterium]
MQTIIGYGKKFKKRVMTLKVYFVFGVLLVFSVLLFAQKEEEVIYMFEMYKMYSALNHTEQRDVWFNKIEEMANKIGNILALQIVYNITKNIPDPGFHVAVSNLKRKKKQRNPTWPIFDSTGQIDQAAIRHNFLREVYPVRESLDEGSFRTFLDKGAMMRLRSEGELDRLVEKIKAPLPDNLCQRGFSDK